MNSTLRQGSQGTPLQGRDGEGWDTSKVAVTRRRAQLSLEVQQGHLSEAELGLLLRTSRCCCSPPAGQLQGTCQLRVTVGAAQASRSATFLTVWDPSPGQSYKSGI